MALELIPDYAGHCELATAWNVLAPTMGMFARITEIKLSSTMTCNRFSRFTLRAVEGFVVCLARCAVEDFVVCLARCAQAPLSKSFMLR